MSISPQVWGYVSVFISAVSYIPYFATLFSGRTKPHAFSWFIWAFLGGTAFVAQYQSGAGPGAWVTGFTSGMCFIIALFALKMGERHITKSDWVSFIAALLIIPVWQATQNRLYAILLVTAIDTLGFYPTIRKSWAKPGEEPATTYALNALQYGVSLLAMEQTTMTTAFYPTFLTVANAAFVLMMLARRRVLAR